MTQVGDHIPPSAKPLVPYLRSCREILRIRQALTLQLQSHIVSDGPDGSSDQNHVGNPASSHLSLVVPNQANANVKRITTEATGVRKEYMKTLQENIAIKREYNALFDRITSRRAADLKTAPHTAVNSQEVFNHYLDLLRERRRYEELQLFDIHLKEWAATSEPPTEQDNSRLHLNLDGLVIEKGDGSTNGPRDNVHALISKLEKTVVRAKAKLAREQHLLKQLQDLQVSTRSANNTISPNVRALQRTRDELVQWVEEKLAITGTGDDTNEPQYENGTAANSTETSQLAAAEYKSRIQEQYVAYVKARQSLLDAISGLSQPYKNTVTAPNISAQKPPEVAGINENTEEWGSIDVFQNVSEHILPASKYQKSLALQRSYLVGMLAKEKTNLKHTMDRLSQESHLLPQYPILARQPQFRHITPAASAGVRQDHRAGKVDEIVERAQAWAFAAEAAGSSESDYIQQRIEHGAEMADTASEQLQQVYNILRQEQSTDNDDKDDTAQQESDIWTAEVQPRKARAKRIEKVQHTKGPWSALDGSVGIN
ncbi:hypothetical protein TMatcc_008328 [Talaromyces marneffei ATCC 18224]|uniref:Uncharacterized protein n=2 Tax=Talaromyces marneffei TaxID=37727 RepID=B6QMA8_TALMQ|nr:uncharacterized protein EYB26_007677 [Talaromyces marneffei]EEA22235.1 conserved hypothetical protein [Talaromyces marneffei ATCC 18224]KAE8550312.1 hypothetical protein EYB25_006538 [Talaromyces marneffei]QGA19977.1 hypothetical protein EYB26_007677 [Talaromyces marneffei]